MSSTEERGIESLTAPPCCTFVLKVFPFSIVGSPLSENLLQHRHSLGHSFLQGIFTFCGLGPPWASGGYLLHCEPPCAAGAACLTVICSICCRETSAAVTGARPPFLLHWPKCLQSCFLHLIFLHSSLSHTAAVQCFYPFVNKFSNRYHQPGCGFSCAQWWVCWSQVNRLEPSGTARLSDRYGSTLFSQSAPLQSLASSTVPRTLHAPCHLFCINSCIPHLKG